MLHIVRNISWEAIESMYPFEIDMLCSFISEENDRKNTKNNSLKGYENATYY